MVASILRERVIEKLQDVPEKDLRHVLIFLETLTRHTTNDDDPLLSVIGSLSGKPLSAEEVENDLYTPTDAA